MSLGEEIRLMRQKSLLSQEAFSGELHVALSTVNRWEKGKARPNLSAIKMIKLFCEKHDYPYEKIEIEWLACSAEE